MADRIDKRAKKSAVDKPDAPSKYGQSHLEKRRQRFEGKAGKPPHVTSISAPMASSPRDESCDSDAGPVVGTCTQLEKKYFRLTSAPKPETVRPVPVLQQTLELLKSKWRQESNYAYICDQFKSLRQDLTVQHVRSAFTVQVYEMHARIALERGDLGEYNQCQTVLRQLYRLRLGGHPAEFLAYRILYLLHTSSRPGLNALLAELAPADAAEPAVQHALAVRAALAAGNYHAFFRLYLDTPNRGGYLMDMFVGRERLAALANICRA